MEMMPFKWRAYFRRVAGEGATAIQLLEFLGQMGNPLRALTDQQHIELVIHKSSIEPL